MITTQLRNLLLAVVCIFAGVSAQAQLTGSAEQYPTSGYEGSPIAFDLAEVATALGSDAATLGAAINEYVTAEAPATILFAANGTEWSAAIEAANHGFWMAMDGTPVGYGETSVWYCSPEVDEAFTALTFNVGQMPNVMKVGDKGEVTITLKFNDKQVTFALALNVIAKPELVVPEPTVIEKDLQIVGQQEIVVEQYPRGDYSSDPVKVDISEALALLGITEKAALAENIDKVLYATWYNNGAAEDGGGMKKDSLTNTPTAGGHGFWLTTVQNANGEEDGEVSAVGWGQASLKFFAENFTYNAENDSLICYVGQNPGALDNETYFTYIYIIYGEKAYKIKYTLKLLETEQGEGLAAYTKVGEVDVTVEQEPLTDWAAVQAKPDVEAIAAALGCEVSAMGLVALDDKDNFGASTANNGGWWLTENGLVVAYSNGAFYIEPAEANNYSVLNVGHMPNTRQVGDELKASLYFTSGTNYYQYNLTLKIVEPQMVEYNFESVATRTLNIQALATADYTEVEFGSITAEDLEALIGTSSPTLYGLNIDSVAAVKGTYSNAYSCDPKPGYWLNKEGRVSVWGDANSSVAVGYKPSTGVFYHNQKPSAMSVGDVFTTQLFFVNEETNKMITFNIIINYVDQIVESEIVGEENLVLPVTLNETDVDIDLAKAAEALGVTVDDLFLSTNYYLHGLTSAGVYGEGANCENGLSFNPDGGYDGYGAIYFTIIKDGDKTKLSIASNDPVAEDFTADAQFCFQIDAKQYVYHARLVSEKGYTGIQSVAANKQDGQLYDLTGRQVKKGQRGLYILNGRKFIQK